MTKTTYVVLGSIEILSSLFAPLFPHLIDGLRMNNKSKEIIRQAYKTRYTLYQLKHVTQKSNLELQIF